MKAKSVHVLLLLCAVIASFSCRKEKMISSNVQLLTRQSWTYNEFGIDQNLDGQIDIPTEIEPCTQDDLVTFYGDGSGSFDQGSNMCYPEFPQSSPFNWQFHNDETQIEYGGTIHNILTLDENQLTIYTEENDGVSTVRHILVYKH